MATRLSADRLWSNQPTHPGAVLREELEARGMTQEELATRMNCPVQTVIEIGQGTKGITADAALALAFEAAIPDGPQATFWMNLQGRYELALARLRREAV